MFTQQESGVIGTILASTCNRRWKKKSLYYKTVMVIENESVSYSVVSNFLQLMDGSLPGSSVHGIPQARILEWVAIPFSRGSS